MDKLADSTPDGPKDSADNLDNINEDDVDRSQSAPGDEEPESDGPSVADAFRSGS